MSSNPSLSQLMNIDRVLKFSVGEWIVTLFIIWHNDEVTVPPFLKLVEKAHLCNLGKPQSPWFLMSTSRKCSSCRRWRHLPPTSSISESAGHPWYGDKPTPRLQLESWCHRYRIRNNEDPELNEVYCSLSTRSSYQLTTMTTPHALHDLSLNVSSTLDPLHRRCSKMAHGTVIDDYFRVF